MARNIDKALYGPSMFEVVCGAVLGLLAGVAVACVYLVFKPVSTVRELPKEQPRGMVYYIPGVESNAKGADWKGKLTSFASGRTVVLVEDELNMWVASSVNPDAPKKSDSDEILIPAKPNFKIAGNQMQIGLNCTLNWYGLMRDVTFQSKGTFQKIGDHFVFVPETLYLGSCPLHFIPGASNLLVSRLVGKRKVPDELKVAWNNLNDVVVDGDAIRLVAAQ